MELTEILQNVQVCYIIHNYFAGHKWSWREETLLWETLHAADWSGIHVKWSWSCQYTQRLTRLPVRRRCLQSDEWYLWGTRKMQIQGDRCFCNKLPCLPREEGVPIQGVYCKKVSSLLPKEGYTEHLTALGHHIRI